MSRSSSPPRSPLGGRAGGEPVTAEHESVAIEAGADTTEVAAGRDEEAGDRPSHVARASAETVHGEFIGASREILVPHVSSPADRPTSRDAPELRYQDRGLIGSGGQGDVRRIFDRHVGRVLAMKVLSFERLHHVESHMRFWHEARITANLHHPTIVPIHDMGKLADGRPYFTMAEVRGRTFEKHIGALHEVEEPAEQRRGLRRLIQALVRACEGLAYSHSRGIIHRDVKPQNLMVGRFGEVMIMDWGLATRLDGEAFAELGDPPPSWEPPLAHEEGSAIDSLAFAKEAASTGGTVAGTIAYMPPEQAGGEREEMGPWSDTYALGAVLYQILTGRPPYTGTRAQAMMALATGPPRSLGTYPVSVLRPLPLQHVCEAAMAREPTRRLADASLLARELEDWLDDVERQDRAAAIVSRADRQWHRKGDGIAGLQAEEQVLRERATRLLAPLQPHDPLHRKKPAWALEDRAEQIARRAAVKLVEWEQTLRSALNEVPDFPDAHRRLAAYYRAQLEEAERMRRPAAVARAEALLRAHDQGEHAAMLEGTGRLSLRTDPPARVQLYRYRTKHRRLVATRTGELGSTPLVDVELASGSYLLVLRAPGCQRVRYPVYIERGGRWSGTGPDGEPFTLRLPQLGELAPDDVFVPAGPFVAGGDPEAAESMSRRVVWLPSFVVKRHPVTCAEYLEFINALVAAGREEEAVQHAPKRPRGPNGTEPTLCWSRDANGAFALPNDALHSPRLPVVQVSWYDAGAYAAWRAARDGRPWRRLSELEWVKAARGVDGRFFPWGDQLEQRRANLVGSHEGDPRPLPVDDDHARRHDRSVYGVRHVAGNVHDWCEERWRAAGPDGPDGATPSPLRAVRGGSWASSAAYARIATRAATLPERGFMGVGFRVARSL